MEERLKGIKAIITDVDGVLTDGCIHMTPQGEGKTFSVVDGMGFKLAEKAGLKTGILSGRASKVLATRAEELGIAVIKMGRLDKQSALQEIAREMGMKLDQFAYIGDDLPDLAPIQMAGAGFCPMDARDEVKAHAHVIPVPGGRGVFRWVVENVLKVQGVWPDIVTLFEVQHG